MHRKTQFNNILNFLAEAGQLKRVRRSGWWVVGITNGESVAEHSFRCAVLGYLIAKLEKADPYRIMLMCLFNDIHEARINDLHKIGHRYIDFSSAETKAFADQLKLLPPEIRGELKKSRLSYSRQESKEALIARDADILECVLQAKEYLAFGFKEAQSFISVGGKFLKTKTARMIFCGLNRWQYRDWWRHLKKFER